MINKYDMIMNMMMMMGSFSTGINSQFGRNRIKSFNHDEQGISIQSNTSLVFGGWDGWIQKIWFQGKGRWKSKPTCDKPKARERSEQHI